MLRRASGQELVAPMQLPIDSLLDEFLDGDLVVDCAETQAPHGRFRETRRQVLERLGTLKSGSCHGAKVGGRQALVLVSSRIVHSCMLELKRAEGGALPMIRTDCSPVSTALTDHRSTSALSDIDRRVWLLGSAVSLALVALWWATPIGWLAPVASATAIAAAIVDWRTLRVPNRLTLSGLVATAVVAAPLVLSDAIVGWDLMLGALVMAGPLLVSHLATRGRTPGLGDVKLAGVLGLTLGAASMTIAYGALLASLLIGAVFGLWYQRLTGRRGFPFAPAIALGTIGVLAVAGAMERGLV
jgi:leader peptidase (prepilin peptidase)/N-methyltransferase